ncbi:transmembrane protein 92 [Pelodytes ibericus]
MYSLHRTVYTKLLSSCLLPFSTAVSRCSVTECLDGSSCCEPQTKIYLDYSWYGPLFIGMLIVFSVLCLCGICNNGCSSQSRSGPPSPRGTPLSDLGPPPPYSEVTAKPFLYPPSATSPPSYTSVIETSPSSSNWEGQS